MALERRDFAQQELEFLKDEWRKEHKKLAKEAMEAKEYKESTPAASKEGSEEDALGVKTRSGEPDAIADALNAGFTVVFKTGVKKTDLESVCFTASPQSPASSRESADEKEEREMLNRVQKKLHEMQELK